ncbi:MAG: hypothetical protein ACK4YG_10770 [Bacteroidota bacterium]
MREGELVALEKLWLDHILITVGFSRQKGKLHHQQGFSPKSGLIQEKYHPLFFVLKQRKAPKENSRRIDPTSRGKTCSLAIRQPARCVRGAIAL